VRSDCGPEVLLDCIDRLTAAEVAPFGAGSEADAARPLLIDTPAWAGGGGRFRGSAVLPHGRDRNRAGRSPAARLSPVPGGSLLACTGG
jgi:hypothetical protein